MITSQDILQFHFSPTTLKNSAQRIIPITLSSLNEHRINKLYKISEEVGTNSFSFSGNNLIPQVFRKFKNSIDAESRIFERRELRTLTYSLSYSENNLQTIFSSANELKIALESMETNWRDSFLLGLIDCLLSNWETKHQRSLEQLEKFITKKLDNYTGNRNTLNSFKNNKRYFNTKNGNLILGDTIAKLNKPIQEATKILGVPDSWFSYSYFSRVIVTYYERNRNNIINIIDTLENIFIFHSLIKTKIRLIPKIVIQANEPNYIAIKDKVKKIALTNLKDPQNKGESLWSSINDISEKENIELLKAKEILLQWMAEEFIDFFFKECINDPRRRKFWVKYSKQISTFKIVGSAYTKRMLLSNTQINKLVDPRFASTNSQHDRNSALMFVIKDYLFVEFSDQGAFYAYKISNTSAPSIESKFFFQTSDLKTTSMNLLAYRTGSHVHQTNLEGKLGHNDGDLSWEEVATYWLNNIAGINV